MQRLEVTYGGDASSVPQARHAVAAALLSWGLDPLSWSASLLVTELAANVTLHARTPFTVVLQQLPDGAVRLAVSDASPRLPRQRHFGEESTTGRGLLLVEELSRTWGVERRTDGKTVWAELSGTGGARTSVVDDEADLDALLMSFPDLEDDRPGPTARAA